MNKPEEKKSIQDKIEWHFSNCVHCSAITENAKPESMCDKGASLIRYKNQLEAEEFYAQ